MAITYLHPALIGGRVYLAPVLPPAAAANPDPDPDPDPQPGTILLRLIPLGRSLSARPIR